MDYDDNMYILFPMTYPWTLNQKEKELTEEKVAEILTKYANILHPNEDLMMDYLTVENGG